MCSWRLETLSVSELFADIKICEKLVMRQDTGILYRLLLIKAGPFTLWKQESMWLQNAGILSRPLVVGSCLSFKFSSSSIPKAFHTWTHLEVVKPLLLLWNGYFWYIRYCSSVRWRWRNIRQMGPVSLTHGWNILVCCYTTFISFHALYLILIKAGSDGRIC